MACTIRYFSVLKKMTEHVNCQIKNPVIYTFRRRITFFIFFILVYILISFE